MCLSPKKYYINGKDLILPCGFCSECLSRKYTARVNKIREYMRRVKVNRGGIRL